MRVLLPIDGSGYSRQAVREAAEIAAFVPCEITLLTVSSYIRFHDPVETALNHRHAIELPSYEEVTVIHTGALDILREKGQFARSLREQGDAADKILEVAERLEIDLIVMGSHGNTGIRRFLLGSVSDRVVTHANCSVLVARGKTLHIGAP